MMNAVESRLAALGIVLPSAPAPVANYVPAVASGGILHVSGQISMTPDGLITGRLGDDLDVAEGRRAARACALNLIAQVKVALDGDLSRVVRVVRLGGFVAATPDFRDHPAVINGASDLMVEAFGDAGRHARAAVGVACLPLGAAVEIDGVFAIA